MRNTARQHPWGIAPSTYLPCSLVSHFHLAQLNDVICSPSQEWIAEIVIQGHFNNVKADSVERNNLSENIGNIFPSIKLLGKWCNDGNPPRANKTTSMWKKKASKLLIAKYPVKTIGTPIIRLARRKCVLITKGRKSQT
jgi:hypothetical protein